MSYNVFISSVSNEFGDIRPLIEKDLKERDRRITLEIQEHMAYDPDANSILEKLEASIASCSAVICVHGAQSGWFPPEKPISQEFLSLLPPTITRASATQWEYLFAKRLNKPIQIFRLDPPIVPAHPPTPEDDLSSQAVFNTWLDNEHGGEYHKVSDLSEVRAKILKRNWNREIENRFVTLWRQAKWFLFPLIVINFGCWLSNAGTVFDLAPIRLLLETPPKARYYIEGNSTHAHLVASPPGAIAIEGKKPIEISTSLQFDVWDLQNVNRIMVKATENKTDITGWPINFDDRGPCIPYAGACFQLSKSGNRLYRDFLANWNGSPEAHLGQATVMSRFDQLAAEVDMIPVLGGLGFSMLFTVMIREFFQFGQSFMGAYNRLSRRLKRFGRSQGCDRALQ